MNDIHGLKPDAFYDLGFLYLIFFIILLYLIFFIYKKYTKTKKYEIEKISYKQKNIDFLELLRSIKHNYLNENSEIFYGKFKSLIILYLENTFLKNFSKLTLYEIEIFEFNKEIKILLKEVYFRQYSKNVFCDDSEFRKDLIKKFEEIIKQNKS